MAGFRGIIGYWFGTVATIPHGWIICNGNNGTPNMLNNIIRAAGGSFVSGDTGGAISHDHVATGDGHSHRLPAGTDIDDFSGFLIQTDTEVISGTALTENHLPQYHALVPIMQK